MSYLLNPRPRSNDFDIVDAVGTALGQVIASDDGFRIYILGELESLLATYSSADEALAAFEEWMLTEATRTTPVLADHETDRPAPHRAGAKGKPRS